MLLLRMDIFSVLLVDNVVQDDNCCRCSHNLSMGRAPEQEETTQPVPEAVAHVKKKKTFAGGLRRISGVTNRVQRRALHHK